MSTILCDDGPKAVAGDRKVALATTVYSDLDPSYVFAIQQSREHLHRLGFKTAYYLLAGNCHVDDARNSIVQEFLASDCTDLVFLDADVSWEPEDLARLCRYEVDLVGAVYPYRREEVTDENLPVQMVPGKVEPRVDGLIEVAGLPTGFMRISRNVLEILARSASKYFGRTGISEIPILFERTFDAGVRWGGDLAFCAKWRAEGGSVWAAPEITLGHTGKVIVHDSLGAALRRQSNQTLRHVVDQIRAGNTDRTIFAEARKYAANPMGALEDVLVLCTVLAREAKGPIIEAGSGMTTIVMAAATEEKIYCLEHDPIWALQLQRWHLEAGVDGVGCCEVPITDGWYDLSSVETELPERFALGVVDGPPRKLCSRLGFFEHLGERCDMIVVDDADDRAYAQTIKQWCLDMERDIQFMGRRAALITRKKV